MRGGAAWPRAPASARWPPACGGDVEPLRHAARGGAEGRVPGERAVVATRPRSPRASGSRATAGCSASAPPPPPTSRSSPATDRGAVLLRQRFGGISAGRDGLIAVGVRTAGSRTSPPRWRPTRDHRLPRHGRRRRGPRRGLQRADRRRDAVRRPHAARLDRARRRPARPPGAGAAGRGADAEGRRPPGVGDDAARRRPWPPPRLSTPRPARYWSARASSTTWPTTRPGRSSPTPAPELLLHRHAPALVLARDDELPARARQPGLAPVGRRRPRQAPDVHHPGQQLRRRPQLGRATTRSPLGTEPATPRLDREYTYPWTNQWNRERCNPTTTFTSAERNDIDAARANLFVMHNRMHDWSYGLGFTETRVEHAGVQLRPRRARERPRAGQRPGRRRSGSAPRRRRETTPTRSPRTTACCRSRTCTCGSRSRPPSTRRAWTATTTCR